MTWRFYEACSQNIPVKRKAKENIIPKDRVILMRKRKLLRRKLNSTNNKKKKDKINLKIVNIEVLLMRSHENERQRNEAKVFSLYPAAKYSPAQSTNIRKVYVESNHVSLQVIKRLEKWYFSNPQKQHFKQKL